jgi:hypothetical protein
MWKWIHHLLEPHCEHCKQERDEAKEENKLCLSCETLRSQLATANHREEQLLARILELTAKPAAEPAPRIIAPELLKPRAMPWRVKQQMLEEEDRNEARIIAEQRELRAKALAETIKQNEANKQQSIERLEQEVGLVGEAK